MSCTLRHSGAAHPLGTCEPLRAGRAVQVEFDAFFVSLEQDGTGTNGYFGTNKWIQMAALCSQHLSTLSGFSGTSSFHRVNVERRRKLCWDAKSKSQTTFG